MIDKPEIKKTTTQHTACIHLQVTLEEMRQTFGPAVEELVATLAEQGMPSTAAVFAHHFCRMRGDGVPPKFDLEVGFVTETSVTSAGRVYASQWPAQTVANTTYHGPYEGLEEAWGEFSDWMENNGINQAADLWEHYVIGPEKSPNSSQWRTEFYRPLL